MNILELLIVLSTLIFGMRHLVSSWIHPHKWYLSLVTRHSSFHVMRIVYTVEPPLLATTLRQPLFLSQQKVHTFTLVLTSYNGHLSTQQKPLEFVLVIKKTSWQLPVKQLLTNFEYKTKLFIVLWRDIYLTLFQVYGGVYPADKHWYRCRVKELVGDGEVHLSSSVVYILS